MMKTVKCISERKSNPSQIKVGSEYYIDTDTLYTDEDNDSYVQVYKDKAKKHYLGYINTSHFTH